MKRKKINFLLVSISLFIFLACAQPTSMGDGGANGNQDSSGELLLANDTLESADWNVYAGKETLIPTANLLENDENYLNSDPLVITEVGNAQNGSVSISGSSITFIASVVGHPASFTYTAEISGTSYSASATVLIDEVKIPPSVLAKADGPYDIQQGEEIYKTTADLIGNDEAFTSISFVDIVTGSEVGCSVSSSGSNLTITSTGLAYGTAQFDYRIKDDDNSYATGTVYLNVTPLTSINGYVFDDENTFNAMKNSYTPASMEDVFLSWSRVSGTYYYTSAPYSGSADSWVYKTDDVDGDGVSDPRVVQPDNVSPPEGFVCPETDALENYTFEATLFSSSTDDDSIGLIIAFTRDGGVNKYLVAHRTQGGNSPNEGWGISYYEGTSQTILSNVSVGGVNRNSSIGDGLGWNSRKSRVKVQRSGDTITCWTTDWDKEDSYEPSSEMVIDLNDDSVNGVSTNIPDLSIFRGAKQYGYYTYSQPDSTYLDISLSGGISADTLILLTGGDDSDSDGNDDSWTGSQVWTYGSSWVLSGNSIQDELGYIREVTNPETDTTYLIQRDKVDLVP